MGLFVWAYSEVKSQTWTIGNLGETRFTISFVGFVIALFILFKNALGDIDHLISQRGKVVTFLGSVNNPYPWSKLFDNEVDEIYIIGQNLRTILSDQKFKRRIVDLIKKNSDLVVTFIMSPPEVMDAVFHERKETSQKQYKESLKDLKLMKELLDKEEDKIRLRVHFHSSIISLSCMIRDPENINRGVMVLTVKWALDFEPKNRLHIVVEKWADPDVFQKIYGSISAMTQVESGSLEEMCSRMKV